MFIKKTLSVGILLHFYSFMHKLMNIYIYIYIYINLNFDVLKLPRDDLKTTAERFEPVYDIIIHVPVTMVTGHKLVSC